MRTSQAIYWPTLSLKCSMPSERLFKCWICLWESILQSLFFLREEYKQAFAQRRKTLRNSLRALFDEDQIINAGISPGARAEELTIDQFAKLTDHYHGNKNQ